MFVLVKMGFSNVIVSIHGCKFLNLCPEKMLPPRFEMVASKINLINQIVLVFFCPKVEPNSTCCKQNTLERGVCFSIFARKATHTHGEFQWFNHSTLSHSIHAFYNVPTFG